MKPEADVTQLADIPRLRVELKRNLEKAQSNLEAAQRDLEALERVEALLRQAASKLVSKHSRLRDLVLEILRKAECPLNPGEIVERAKQHGWEFETDRNGWSSVNTVLSRRKRKVRDVRKLSDGRWEVVK
jgi:predicted nuclease with TOPRIM domain